MIQENSEPFANKFILSLACSEKIRTECLALPPLAWYDKGMGAIHDCRSWALPLFSWIFVNRNDRTTLVLAHYLRYRIMQDCVLFLNFAFLCKLANHWRCLITHDCASFQTISYPLQLHIIYAITSCSIAQHSLCLSERMYCTQPPDNRRPSCKPTPQGRGHIICK